MRHTRWLTRSSSRTRYDRLSCSLTSLSASASLPSWSQPDSAAVYCAQDIPEGGSKAACVVEPYGTPEVDHFLQRKSIKAFSNTLLDFMSTEDDVAPAIIDTGGGEDIVYLGPDENVLP